MNEPDPLDVPGVTDILAMERALQAQGYPVFLDPRINDWAHRNPDGSVGCCAATVIAIHADPALLINGDWALLPSGYHRLEYSLEAITEQIPTPYAAGLMYGFDGLSFDESWAGFYTTDGPDWITLEEAAQDRAFTLFVQGYDAGRMVRQRVLQDRKGR